MRLWIPLPRHTAVDPSQVRETFDALPNGLPLTAESVSEGELAVMDVVVLRLTNDQVREQCQVNRFEFGGLAL